MNGNPEGERAYWTEKGGQEAYAEDMAAATIGTDHMQPGEARQSQERLAQQVYEDQRALEDAGLEYETEKIFAELTKRGLITPDSLVTDQYDRVAQYVATGKVPSYEWEMLSTEDKARAEATRRFYEAILQIEQEPESTESQQ